MKSVLYDAYSIYTGKCLYSLRYNEWNRADSIITNTFEAARGASTHLRREGGPKKREGAEVVQQQIQTNRAVQVATYASNIISLP